MVKEGKTKYKFLLIVGLIFLISITLLNLSTALCSNHECQDFCGDANINPNGWCQSGCSSNGCYCSCSKGLWWCTDSSTSCDALSYCVGNDVGLVRTCNANAENKCSGTTVTQVCPTNSGCISNDWLSIGCYCNFGSLNPLQPHWYDWTSTPGCETNAADNSHCGGNGPQIVGNGVGGNLPSCSPTKHDNCLCHHTNSQGEVTWFCNCECDNNWGNCNNNLNDGCEINLTNNDQYCGSCDLNCSARGPGWKCINNYCNNFIQITSVTLTPNCLSESCDLLDQINATVNFVGRTDDVKQVKLDLGNGGGCIYSTAPFGCDPQTTSVCTGQFLILDVPNKTGNNCTGKWINKIINASALDDENNILTFNSSATPDGQFQFTQNPSELKDLDLIPHSLDFVSDYTFPLKVLAIINKSNTNKLEYINITTNINTHFDNFTRNFINITRQGDAVLAIITPWNGNKIAKDMVVMFPFNFLNQKSDLSTISIWPRPTNCYIKSASINSSACNENNCNISDKILLNITSICSNSFNTNGLGIIKMEAWDENHICLVHPYGNFQQYTGRITVNWTVNSNDMNWSTCEGKTVFVKYLGLWNRSEDTMPLIQTLVASNYSDTSYGNFTFWIEPPIAPPNATSLWFFPTNYPPIAKGQKFSYLVLGNITGIIQDITLNENTVYNSSNETVTYSTGQKNIFYTNESGQAIINVTYPYGWPGNLTNETNVNIYRPTPGCEIYEPSITTYCDPEGCNNGNITTLFVKVNSTCINTYHMNKINMSAMSTNDPACKFELNAIPTIGSETLPGTKDTYGNWMINVPTNCSGKNAIIFWVGIENRTNLLNSMTGNLGQINFRESMTILPPMKAIIVNPTENQIFNLTDEIPLNESSFGNITTWTWYYKGNQDWQLYQYFSLGQNPNTTITFQESTTPGSYFIKLTVNNETMNDSTKVKIHLCSQNGVPCAVISDPKEGEIKKDGRAIFFNASESFDSNSEFNLTWFFGDGTNTTWNASINKTGYHVYNSNQAKLDPFTVNLNAKDGQNLTTDSINFKIAVCDKSKINQGTGFVFAGDCINGKEYYCDNSSLNFIPNCGKTSYRVGGGDGFDVPTGCGCISWPNVICDDRIGRGNCIEGQSVEDCGSLGNLSACLISTTGLPTSCYWSTASNPKCQSCYDNQGTRTINSCSDYSVTESCNKDNCQLGQHGAGTNDCGQTTPDGKILITNCHCQWNATASRCDLNKTRVDITAIGPNGHYNSSSCSYAVTSKECGSCLAGKGRLTTLIVTAFSGPQNSCTNNSECNRCGIAFEKLPFFTEWQIPIVMLIIALGYFVMFKKRKYKKE